MLSTGTYSIYFVFMLCTISLLVDLLRTGTYYYGYPTYKDDYNMSAYCSCVIDSLLILFTSSTFALI